MQPAAPDEYGPTGAPHRPQVSFPLFVNTANRQASHNPAPVSLELPHSAHADG
jgi:hypothetical protein